MVKTIVYHGTDKKKCLRIEKEGFIFPIESSESFFGQALYFHTNPKNVQQYGDALVKCELKYNPKEKIQVVWTDAMGTFDQVFDMWAEAEGKRSGDISSKMEDKWWNEYLLDAKNYRREMLDKGIKIGIRKQRNTEQVIVWDPTIIKKCKCVK